MAVILCYDVFYVAILGIKEALTLSRKKNPMPTNIIDYVRIALYATVVAIALVLFQAWDKDHPKTDSANTTATINSDVPNLANTNIAPVIRNTVIETAQHIIHVTTDTLDVNINVVGGNITQVKLIKYPQELHSDIPFLLLNNSPEKKYIAQSGLLSSMGPDTIKGQALFTSAQTEYSLDKNQNELQVKLHWQNEQGLKVTKIFTFQKNTYEIGVAYQIDNQSTQQWQGNLYTQLMRKNTPPASSQGLMNLPTYFGAAVSSPEKPYQKVTFKQMEQQNLDQTVPDGWVAMIQHYFVSAWVPDKTTTSHYFSKVANEGLYVIGMVGPASTVAPGATTEIQAKFYAGPSIAENLEKAAPGLQLTIDYGWFWFISIAIFWMMQHINDIIGNWGWSIVLVTVVIKLLFYPLSAKSYRSMSMLKNLQPRINQLKERYGEDKQKFTQATLELYKKEKVNPMSGCLPMLVQIPVFIGLYWVLIESVQLRHAPFIWWIHDLSVKDPYYILPVLMGITFFLQQRLNPPPPDPMQAKVMMFMPVLFTFLFMNFPAGLMVYWCVNNVLSYLQQWYIMRNLVKAEKGKKAK